MASPSLAVIGHSFVRRLGEFVEGRHLSRQRRPAHRAKFSNLRIPGERVTFFGLGGACVAGRRGIVPALHGWLDGLNLKAIYVDLGSNDLCDAAADPESVANNLISLANFLHFGYEIPCVIIGQITQRIMEPYEGYNRKVAAANAAIRRRVSESAQGIFFTTLRGLREPLASRFLPDGVHYNSSGNDKYAQGVRGAFLRCLRGTLH